MPHPSTATSWPRLLAAMAATLIAALSVHVIMLQGLHVPYPDNSLVAWGPRTLNVALAMLATILFTDLAAPRLARYGLTIRALLVFLVFSMLHEALVRAVVMDGVTTTAWTFSLLKNLPELLTNLVVCTAIVLAAPRLGSFWRKLVAALLLTALFRFVCQPLIGVVFSVILQHLAFLAHDDVYAAPYGWQVLVPAYITFAEPVVASFAVAFVVWDRLAATPWLRTAQLVGLIMLIKGSIVPTLFYGFYLKDGLLTGIASEAQFGLEALTLAVMTALFWQYGRALPTPQPVRPDGSEVPGAAAWKADRLREA